MDRTNWMVELHPDEAEPSNKHLKDMKLVFSETPTGRTNARYNLFHHYSSSRKRFLEEHWRMKVQSLYNRTENELPEQWWMPSVLFGNSTLKKEEERGLPDFDWANEFVRKRVMAYGVPKRIMDKYRWDSIIDLMMVSENEADVLVASNPEIV